MTAAQPLLAASECEQMLDLLARHKSAPAIADILADAREIRLLLSRYSFRTPETAERLCAEISSRYRAEILTLSGNSMLLRRQSSSVYLRLEQLLSLLVRVALLRLSRTGALNVSQTQLMHSDGMLLVLLQSRLQTKTDG